MWARAREARRTGMWKLRALTKSQRYIWSCPSQPRALRDKPRDADTSPNSQEALRRAKSLDMRLP